MTDPSEEPDYFEYPESHHEETVTVDGVQLRVALDGAEDEDGEYPDVLLIHGNSSDQRIWRRLLAGPLSEGPLASKIKGRIISFDLPGHGRSGPPVNPGEGYTMAGYAQLTLKMLRFLGVKTVIIIGTASFSYKISFANSLQGGLWEGTLHSKWSHSCGNP